MKTKFKDLSREEAIRIIVEDWHLDSYDMQVLSVLIPELQEDISREEALRRVKAWNLAVGDMEVLSVLIPELHEELQIQ